ncbi:MYB/SANT-LIKE DNA-BINDING DOMAIN PROTEIN [Salix purpurea]|uniref:MYB/SANT-LIKE DNA-BINDING DOMAIN PROTEIN n=1 Tax=Salix purpurea TaxID=77065 RepID=A0A9Q0ZVL0_SALPP|nr:MYB/SANT-LIKE DNA-BINDING DOMAIN PROTEIN [Salix purpurea]
MWNTELKHEILDGLGKKTFVLIESKRAVDNRFQLSRKPASSLGSDQIEPKWDSVSSYCRHQGVNRGPVQCRKRWGNMLCDFKKIKTWESQNMNGAESFWMMRSELRRERKLPGFFNREVYNVMDGRVITTGEIPLSQITFKKEMGCIDRDEAETAEEGDEGEHEDTKAVFDQSIQFARAEDVLSMDCEKSRLDKIYWSSKKETAANGNLTKIHAARFPISSVHVGTTKKQNLGSNTWTGSMSRERQKKRRLSSDECRDTNLGDMNMLKSQIQAQNTNCMLDREQRKDHNDSLVSALNKLTDALVKIADKL